MASARVMALLVLATALFAATAVLASDPELTTDFAVPAGTDPAAINSSFFTFTGFRGGVQPAPGTFGIKRGFVGAFPALQGLGVSYAILEYAPGTTNPPHTHPRGTELLYVTKGTLTVGLIDSTNKFFGQVLKAGDVFVFPKGLLHYQINLSNKVVRAIAAFSSSNPGTVQVGPALFGSGVPDVALTTAFKVKTDVIDKLQASFAPPPA